MANTMMTFAELGTRAAHVEVRRRSQALEPEFLPGAGAIRALRLHGAILIGPDDQQRRKRHPDMLLGVPTYSIQDGLTQRDLTNYWEMGLFAQDDWKVTRDLTLNLGLRYEVFSPAGGRVGNFDLQKAIVIDSFGPHARSNAGVKYDLHDFGPRFGFAWSPFGSTHTVIRSAAGVFYAPEGNIFNDLGENPPVLEFYFQMPRIRPPSPLPPA